MNDAISRSALLAMMDKYIDMAQDDEMHHAMCAVAEGIKEAPAIDVVPNKPKRTVHFVPCVCGYTKHSEWWDTKNHVWFYDCLKCGIKSDKYAGKTKTDAKIGWNRMIEEMKSARMDGEDDGD